MHSNDEDCAPKIKCLKPCFVQCFCYCMYGQGTQKGLKLPKGQQVAKFRLSLIRLEKTEDLWQHD